MEMKYLHGLYLATSKSNLFGFIYYLFILLVLDFGKKLLTNLNFRYFCYSDVATDEVNHLFAASDNDGDDRLSYEEIVDNHDLFVGSEATDYGDHLQNIDKLKDEL